MRVHRFTTNGPMKLKFEYEVWVVGAIYFGYFVAALVAAVLLAAHPADDGVLEYAYWVVFVTSALHFGFMLLGLLQGYKAHPVPPKWAFLYADYVMAGALGATIAGYLLDHDNRTPPAIGNAVVMATQVFCARKTWVLLSDVWHERRDPETGALLE